ncbi:hypothetical protein ACFVAJ_17815 [Agromyces sp. NPDC057679]|uniref:hypothetical protein n=1 Tax=Agromyces sp. NPDC057679 TaxID=3346207 RepID=UPI00366DA73C
MATGYDVTEPDAPIPTTLTAEVIVEDLAYAYENGVGGWFSYESSETKPGILEVTQYGKKGEIVGEFEVEFIIRKVG